MLRLAIVTLFALYTAVSSSSYAFSGPLLTFDNFPATTAKGTWFVKHFSPTCPHCQKLAPIWDRLGGELQPLQKTMEFHLAQINCHEQPDLCDDHDVRYYPNMVLYHDGERVDEYTKKATYENLKAWMTSRAEQWHPVPVVPAPVVPVNAAPVVKDVPKKAEQVVQEEALHTSTVAVSTATTIVPTEQAVVEPPPPKWNVQGESVVLTTESFEKSTSLGPWMVKFYAPWCPHCKHLAPIWQQMATELAGTTNVGQVDCTQEGSFCTQQGVQGYPTIKMYNYGVSTDYTGPRTLDALKTFAIKASKSPVVDVKQAELTKLKASHDVFYLLVDQDKKSHISRNFELIARGLLSRLSFYHISADAALVKAELKLAQLPSLVVFKDDTFKVYGKDMEDHKTMREWIVSEQYPALITLDDANARDLLMGENLVVLALLNPEADTFAQKKDTFYKVALEYKKRLEQGTVYVHAHQHVIFVWLDAIKWGGYAERAYRITTDDLPRIILVEPKESEYVDLNQDGHTISFEQLDVLTTLEAVQRGQIRGKSTLGIVAGFVKASAKHAMKVTDTARSNPLASLVVFFGIIGIAYYWMKRRSAYEAVGTKLD